MCFRKTIRRINTISIPSSLNKQQHFEDNDENFDYYKKRIDLLTEIKEFVRRLIDDCDQFLESKKDYKVTMKELKQALYKDKSIDSMLEENIKNLRENGLENLPEIEEIVPTRGETMLEGLLLSSVIVDCYMILRLLSIVWVVELVRANIFCLACTLVVFVICGGLNLQLLTAEKIGMDTWLYWACIRLLQFISLASCAGYLKQKQNTNINS